MKLYSAVINIIANDPAIAAHWRSEAVMGLEDAWESGEVESGSASIGGLFRGDVKALLSDYQRLHVGLSDMIESGRLSRTEVPDDYDWLVASLANMANAIEEVR